MKKIEKTLKTIIEQLHELNDISIESDDLSEEIMHYIQEGYKQGLCSAALLIADELDAETNGDFGYLEQENEWWNGNIHIDDSENLD